MSSGGGEDGVETLREDLIEQTRVDPGLGPRERETALRWAADEAVAHVHTEEAAIIRRLLAHGALEVGALGVHDGDRRHTLTLEQARDQISPGDVVARLRGTIPVGFLKIQSVPRDHDRHAAVVAKQVFRELGGGE